MAIFVVFKQYFTEKTTVFSRIQTRIIGVEGEQADHKTTTTTTAQPTYLFATSQLGLGQWYVVL